MCLFSRSLTSLHLPPLHIRYLALHLNLAVVRSLQFPSPGPCSFPSLRRIRYSIPSISSLFLSFGCSSFPSLSFTAVRLGIHVRFLCLFVCCSTSILRHVCFYLLALAISLYLFLLLFGPCYTIACNLSPLFSDSCLCCFYSLFSC